MTRYFSLIFVPILGTLFFVITEFESIDHARFILGVLLVIQLVFGWIWVLRLYRYSGTINISENEETKLYSLDLNDDPETLEKKKEVVFKVAKNPK